MIAEKYNFKFDLNNILSYLIYGRIIYPSSKLKTHQLSKKFLNCPELMLHHIYRGLTYLNKEMNYIQEKLFENSLNTLDRNSRIIYFDCTNYYFEINEEDDLKKYGINKQHQPKPQVGMGLFMDGDGIPLAMNIFPGNESETKQLLPTENKIVDKFKLKDSRIVICTDAALCTDEVKNYNIKDGRGFVITQSLKKLKDNYQKEALNKTGWRISGDLKKVYNIEDIEDDEELYEQYYNTLFYKIIETETTSVKQDLIVTFSLKYKEYFNKIRNSQIERASRKINNTTKGEKMKLSQSQNDYRRFIKETALSAENKKSEKYEYSINEDLIKDERGYDGYYALTTNLSDDIETILKVSKGRWEIEESFRIMKHDFASRPVELSREDRIKAHFLTCFIALIIYRILEKKLDYKYTTSEILDTLRGMNVFESKGDGYMPGYERTDLTDDLHDLFKFRTDYEILNYKFIEKILNQIKQ
jgi:transposase